MDYVTDGKPDQSDSSLLLDTLIQLASLEFFRGEFDRSLIHLDRARSIVLNTHGSERADADIHWVTALHERQRGRLESALTHAALACSAYAALATPAAFGRIQVVAAEIALDICQRIVAGSDFDHYFRLANTYITGGLGAVADQSIAVPDLTGQGLALLAHVRATRISGDRKGRAADRKGTIEDVIKVAKQLRDSALLCQAYVALGDELATIGSQEGSLLAYQDAMYVAEARGINSLAAPAKRALLRGQEMTTSSSKGTKTKAKGT